MNAVEREAPEPSEIEELLPWHAAGTLSRRDAERVEAALANDPELARRYALVREELSETIHLNETLGAPSAHAMDALFAKIDAEPERRPAASRNFAARLAGIFAGLSPRTLAWSATAAALVILLQAGMLAGLALKPGPRGNYQTASAPSTAAAAGSFALIRFAPQASFDSINTFLRQNKLSIVQGPMPGGLYKVRLAESVLPKAQMDTLVGKLARDKLVVFIVVAR